MAKLDWAKNEQLRRRQRFGSEPIGQIDVSPSSPIVPFRTKQGNKKGKKAGRRRAAPRAMLPTPPQVLVDPAELDAPDAVERFQQEIAHLDQEIAGLEKQLLLRHGRRAAVMAALKKIAPPGKALHAGKLIPAAEAADRKMRRRKKAIARPAIRRGPKTA